MTTKTWKGSGSITRPSNGTWSRSSNWSPSGVPASGDTVILGGNNTYTVTLNISTTVGSLSINDSVATLAIGGSTLTVAGAITDSGRITIAGGTINAAGLTVGSSGSLSGWGTVAAAVSPGTSGGGTVTASGGTLDLTGTVSSGVNLVIATASASDLKIGGSAMMAGAISLSSANQTLEIGLTGSLTLGGTETITGGKIQLDGGALTDNAGISVSTGAILSGWGTVVGALSGGGTITANGGILRLENAVTAPALQIANVSGSDLQLDSTVGTGTTVTFNGANGTLDLSRETSLSNFQGVVTNFAAGDGITVAGAARAALDPGDTSGKTLDVYNSSGGLLGTIALATSYTGDKFSVANGTITVSVPSPPTVTVSNVISGPTDSNNATLNGYNAIPPDNALAVSSTDVLMAENNVIEVTSPTGSVLLNPESTAKFFAAVDSGYSLTDPRAIFDPVSGEFIVTSDALTVSGSGVVTGSAVVYAFSTNPTATGSWTFGSVNTTQTIAGQVTWGDQPTIAWNGAYLDITTAQFGVSSGQYVDNYVTIVPLSGGTPAATSYNFGSTADYRPVAVTGGDYFVGYVRNTGNDELSLQYNANGSNTFSSSFLSLGAIDAGNGSYTAPQLGSSVLLDAGFDDVANAVYANGYLYAVFEVAPTGTQPDVHWVKAAVSNSVSGFSVSLVAQGDITGPSGAVAFNPSIAVDGNGDVLVNYTVSSASMYPAAYASVMPAGSSSFLVPVQYGSSVAPEAATFGVTNNVIRWGDYSSAVVNPAAANSFVVSNEIVPSAESFFNNAPWGTVTATITLTPGTAGAVVSGSTTSSPPSSNTASNSSSSTGPLTGTRHGPAEGSTASVANLDAMNLTAYEPIHGRGFAGMASAFPGSGHGYGGIADSLTLTIPQG